jgi:hypothetical protein
MYFHFHHHFLIPICYFLILVVKTPFVLQMKAEKMKRLSCLREKQEAIKTYLNEIEEEVSFNGSSSSQFDEVKLQKTPKLSNIGLMQPKTPTEEALEFLEKAKIQIKKQHSTNDSYHELKNSVDNDVKEQATVQPRDELNLSVNLSDADNYKTEFHANDLDNSLQFEKQSIKTVHESLTERQQIDELNTLKENEKNQLATILFLQGENDKFK